MNRLISYILNFLKINNKPKIPVNLLNELKDPEVGEQVGKFYTYQEEMWRKIGVIQVIFAFELLRIGKLDSYVSRVTGLSLKEVKKVKDLLKKDDLL